MVVSTATAAFWRAARYTAMGTTGLSAAAIGQTVWMRCSYIAPEEPEGQRHGRAGQQFPGQPLRLLFVGDSTCMGVGASCAAPLQAACAERLAAMRRVPVVWRTIGQTGADVRELRALVTSRPRDGIEKSAAKDFDIAVVLCGVNDGKKLLQGRFPSVFRRDLSALCSVLRQEAPEAAISVPRIPGYLTAPLLQLWPMCHLVSYFFSIFEQQKAAIDDGRKLRSPTPPPEMLPGPDKELWGVDGLHPSSKGYEMVGEWLGTALASTA